MPVDGLGRVGSWLGCVPGACGFTSVGPWWLLIAVAGGALVALGARRAATAVWTLRAASWTPRLSRLLARWVGPQSYSDEEFFKADGAGPRFAERRRAGLDRLAA